MRCPICSIWFEGRCPRCSYTPDRAEDAIIRGIHDGSPSPISLPDLAAVIQRSIAAGHHSEKIAAELCREFGGRRLPEV